MVSLLHLADITEQGVEFQSPVDGSRMLLTPEHSIKIQSQLGADIIMALDDVVSSVHVDDARFAEATDRTTRWIDRCIAAHSKPQEQNLFAIVQVRPLDPTCSKLASGVTLQMLLRCMTWPYKWPTCVSAGHSCTATLRPFARGCMQHMH